MKKSKRIILLSFAVSLVNFFLLIKFAAHLNVITFILWTAVLTSIIFGIFNTSVINKLNASRIKELIILSAFSIVETAVMGFFVYGNSELMKTVMENTRSLSSDTVKITNIHITGPMESMVINFIFLVACSLLAKTIMKRRGRKDVQE